MPLQKSTATWLASQSVGSASSVDSGWIDLRQFGAVTVFARVTNGSPGPNVPCDVIVELSPDNGTTVTERYRSAGRTTAAAVDDFTIDLPIPVHYARLTFDNTGDQAVTVRAYAEYAKIL